MLCLLTSVEALCVKTVLAASGGTVCLVTFGQPTLGADPDAVGPAVL